MDRMRDCVRGGKQERASRQGQGRGGIWAVRLAFSLVFVVNMQCALGFVFAPESFAGAYELSGAPGMAAVQGMGVAFIMWNVTYPAFIANPRRFSVLGWVILAQQAIGLVGETALLLSLPAGHETLAASIVRFIAFDAGGLVIMAVSFGWNAAGENVTGK